CAARSNARQDSFGVEDRVDDPGAKSAEQIKQKVSEMAQAVFNVVAENPQVPHVADQVQPAAMQEHRGEKRHDDRRQRKMRLRPSEHGRRHHAVELDEWFEIAAEREFVKKDNHVDEDDENRNERK